VVPTEAQFTVTGFFKTGMFEYDNAYVFISLEEGQRVAGLDSAVTGIEVSTTDRWVAPAVARQLADSLGYPYRTVDWQEQNSTLFQALKLQKLAMTVILLLIALVAAFTIISNLTMVVSDKTREIGILRAMGMTSRSIGRVFFAQGLIIGLVGTIIGLALGLGVSAVLGRYELVKLDPSIYFIDHLPVANQLSDILFTVLASVVIATLATLSPARTAARLYPVEAIRHE
jgi:lipoprotein-releasing system permease protein